GVLRGVLLRLSAALLRRLEQAVVARRDALVARRVRQQGAGGLVGGGLVEGGGGGVGGDKPVAGQGGGGGGCGCGGAGGLGAEAGVGVADGVEPVQGHALAEVRRREQAVYLLRVCRLRLSAEGAEELVHLLRCRRQPGQVERQASQQRPCVRLGGGLQAGLGQLLQDEVVNGVVRPGRPRDRRHRPPLRRD